MFIPHDPDELIAALERGDLVETATFEGKAFPTASKGNIEIAKDIAAMATDGGVIIYGIGEDSDKRLTVDQAFPLAGQPERISNIVATNLSDPPKIKITRIETPTQPERGYLVVEVPQSRRAPHMVQIRGENRYYGRDATGNRVLSAADVERLYRLRAQWERGVDELLDAAIGKRPPLSFQPETQGLFHLVARPLTTDAHLLDRILADESPTEALGHRFSAYPLAAMFGVDWRRVGGGAIATQNGASAESELELSTDGTARLFWVATRNSGPPGSELDVMDGQLAKSVWALLSCLGQLYSAGDLTCAVDLGMVLENVRGATSYFASHSFEIIVKPRLRFDSYRHNTRTTVADLVESPVDAARDLVGSVLDEMSQRRFDPFALP